LKQLYSDGVAEREASIGGFIVDVVRGDSIIEIQTGSFSKIRNKLASLLPDHRVRLVYPIAFEKTLIVYDHNMENIIYRRKSPKKGELLDVVDQMIHIPELLVHPNFSLEVVLTREEEIRSSDGRGSWRRKGISIIDRRLLSVIDRVHFPGVRDYLRLFPHDLPRSFTNRVLSNAMNRPVRKIRKLSYCFRQMGLLRVTGKQGNTLVFEIAGGVSC
jgi:hypothetical protein